jgi:hypothetical protein
MKRLLLAALAATIVFVVASCSDNPVQPAAQSLPVSAVSLDYTVGCNDYDAATGYCWDDWNDVNCDYANPASWCYDPCFPEWCDPGTVLIGSCDPAVEPCPEGGGGGGGTESGENGESGGQACDPQLAGCVVELRPEDLAWLNNFEEWLRPLESVPLEHRDMCFALALDVRGALTVGRVGRGADSLPDNLRNPDSRHAGAGWSDTIHVDQRELDEALVSNFGKALVVTVLLHEIAHFSNPDHEPVPPGGWHKPWESPYYFLTYDSSNPCVKYP